MFDNLNSFIIYYILLQFHDLLILYSAPAAVFCDSVTLIFSFLHYITLHYITTTSTNGSVSEAVIKMTMSR